MVSGMERDQNGRKGEDGKVITPKRDDYHVLFLLDFLLTVHQKLEKPVSGTGGSSSIGCITIAQREERNAFFLILELTNSRAVGFM